MAVQLFGGESERARGAILRSDHDPGRGVVNPPADGSPAVMCSCTAVSLPSPTGEVIVVQVAGDVDLFTVPVLRNALSEGLARGPCELIVDLAAMTFCDLDGLRLLVETGATAGGSGIGYAVADVPTHTGKVWLLLWPPAEIPMQFPTAAEAVLAAMAHHTTIVTVEDHRARPAPTPDSGRVRSRPASPVARPAPISTALPIVGPTSTPQQLAG